MDEEVEKEERGKVMKGVGSIALLPSGSISGHFVQLPNSVCYGLHGTEIACERECSRGEDYRLIKLTITDYNSKRERDVVVECRGHDAARLCNVDHAHGWEKDVVEMLDQKNGKRKIYVSFDCETLKAEDAAEDHIRKFMPKLAGMGAVVNVGTMSITGLEFETEAEHEQFQQNVLRCTSSPVPNRKVEVNVGPTSSTDFGFEEAVPEQIQQKTSQDECSQI